MRILYIEDNPADYRLLQLHLKGSETQLLQAESLQAAGELLSEGPAVDIVLLDLSLPDAQGMEGLSFLQQAHTRLPVVVLTGNVDGQAGIEAIRHGAQDYLVKGAFAPDMLLRTCRYAIERQQMHKQLYEMNQQLQETLQELQMEKEMVEQKNRQVRAFVSLLAHDLKNPVSAISALSELLLSQQTNYPCVPEEHWQRLRKIGSSSSAMLEHILSVINTTKAEEGSLQLYSIAENPFYAITAAIDKYILPLIHRNIIFEMRYKKELPVVRFDRQALHYAITAIMEHILLHAPDSCRLAIAAGRYQHRHLKIVFEVKGVQLALEQLLALMSQSEQQARIEYQLGIGRQLVEAMGGEMGAELRPKGTLLWFTLPLAGEQWEQAPFS